MINTSVIISLLREHWEDLLQFRKFPSPSLISDCQLYGKSSSAFHTDVLHRLSS